MSFSRRNFGPGAGETRGPSDEMLAVDAAGEIRSLTLLYDRYADRLYRFFLVCTGDPEHAERLLRRLLEGLPEGLQRYDREERTFAGWLFAGATALVWREHSWVSRVGRRFSRLVNRNPDSANASGYSTGDATHSLVSFEDIRRGLAKIRPADREVIGLAIGAGLSTVPVSEAMRLPASLVNSHAERAIQSLAGELDAANIPQFREDVEAELGRQSLSGAQRRAHLALIHGLFRGEVSPSENEPSRGPMLEVLGLVAIVVLGLGVIWVWGELTTGDTRQHEARSASESGSQADSIGMAPATSPTQVPEADAGMDGAGSSDSCLAVDGVGAFYRFVNRFNGGDFETVRAMLPGPEYDHPLLEVDPVSNQRLQSVFSHHDTRLASADEITAYLSDRHASGERWEVLEAYAGEHYRHWNEAAPLEMYQDWKREHPGLSMVIVGGMRWIAPDGQEEIASGQVVVDCDQALVIQWDLRRDDSQTGEAISVANFMDAIAPLSPGESREIRARVQTDVREDGGGLSIWEVILSEATGQAGDRLRRIAIRTLDGTEVISYVDDGSRWRLDWRGWVVYGDAEDDEQPVPEEIAQSLPVLRAIPELVDESSGETDMTADVTLTGEESGTTDDPLRERFEVELKGGVLGPARRLETLDRRQRVRPELTVLGVSRSTGFDPDRFEVGMEPPFPEVDVDAPHYQVPESDWPELDVISMNVGSNPVRELYRLSWNGVEFDLAVWPSRGGVEVASVPESADESLTTAVTRYRYGPLVWAHRQFAGYPTDAMWDDGRYRFELAIDRDTVQPEQGWDVRELIRLANALSGSTDDASPVRDRNRGRSSRYPVPSMFNH